MNEPASNLSVQEPKLHTFSVICSGDDNCHWCEFERQLCKDLSITTEIRTPAGEGYQIYRTSPYEHETTA